MQLTMDLKTSAEVLEVNPDKLKNYLQKEQPGGIIRLEEDWHISIFTLVKILKTYQSYLAGGGRNYCQQAIEKVFKAIIEESNLLSGKIHDLVKHKETRQKVA